MNPACGDANTPANLGCLISTVFPNIVHAAIVFIGVVVLFLLVYSGFRFIIAHDDAKQIDSARNMILWAFIGMGVVVFSFLLLNVLATVLNVPCLTDFSFTSCK